MITQAKLLVRAMYNFTLNVSCNRLRQMIHNSPKTNFYALSRKFPKASWSVYKWCASTFNLEWTPNQFETLNIVCFTLPPSQISVMKRVSGEDIHEISPTVGFNIKRYFNDRTHRLPWTFYLNSRYKYVHMPWFHF